MKNFNVNEFKVTGFIAKDATVHNFEKANVASFPLAIGKTYKKGEEEVKESVLTTIKFWYKGDAQEVIAQLKKGDRIQVEGYFSIDSWIDKETNEKQTRLVLVATQFHFEEKETA